ncbi:MAG: S-layer homology domain-containing protein [Candidatus Electryonea clarkiae]|nr:S-layer homology domain-containing protein [Candidatus Electryonea clarkiae]MDP8286325.1 S-layer homology domain-containing protein [Candidatus Electryonea clarkiae]
MKYKILSLAVLIMFSIFLIIGCGPKKLTSESLLDEPEYHVSQGLKLLDRGDVEGAAQSFERAKGLDPKYAEAYCGLALVEAARSNFKEARSMAEKGISLSEKKNPWAYVVRGRVYLQERKGDDWLKKADRDFEKATKMDPELSEAYFWWGVAKKNNFEFNKAGTLFSKAIEFKDDWSERADFEYALVQKIQRAAPGTRVGMKIALMDEITRADLAVLFMEELKLAEVLKKTGAKEYDTGFTAPDDPTQFKEDKEEAKDPVDLENHWANSWIRDILEYEVMELSPDRKFYPNEKITRAEFALFIQNIMIHALHDESIATKYIVEDSRFKDMRSGTATYNAAALCVDTNILDSNLDRTFEPMKTLGGTDALLSIRQFQNRLRMSF